MLVLSRSIPSCTAFYGSCNNVLSAIIDSDSDSDILFDITHGNL